MSSLKQYLIKQGKDKTNPLRFYVYLYLRSKDSTTAKAGTPYYVGKGTGKRAWGKHGNLHLPTNPENIVIVSYDISDPDSMLYERELISLYGRKDNCSGILMNRTDGGEGGSGRIVSIEERKIISMRQTGKMAAKHAITGKSVGSINVNDPLILNGTYVSSVKGSFSWSEDGREHPRGMLGKTHSGEYKELLSETMSGEGNPMYGKSRPDLAEYNRNPTIAAAKGKEYSLFMLNKNLNYFKITEDELILYKNRHSIFIYKDTPKLLTGVFNDISPDLELNKFNLGKLRRLIDLHNRIINRQRIDCNPHI